LNDNLTRDAYAYNLIMMVIFIRLLKFIIIKT